MMIEDVERLLKALNEVDVGEISYSAHVNAKYITIIRSGTFFDCTCPDYIQRGSKQGFPCKHAISLALAIGLSQCKWKETCEIMKELAGGNDDGA